MCRWQAGLASEQAPKLSYPPDHELVSQAFKFVAIDKASVTTPCFEYSAGYLVAENDALVEEMTLKQAEEHCERLGGIGFSWHGDREPPEESTNVWIKNTTCDPAVVSGEGWHTMIMMRPGEHPRATLTACFPEQHQTLFVQNWDNWEKLIGQIFEDLEVAPSECSVLWTTPLDPMTDLTTAEVVGSGHWCSETAKLPQPNPGVVCTL